MPVTLIHFLSLSLMKGSHTDLSSTAWQEIGVKQYGGLTGKTARGCHDRPGKIKNFTEAFAAPAQTWLSAQEDRTLRSV
jgi:hypothetical protein